MRRLRNWIAPMWTTAAWFDDPPATVLDAPDLAERLADETAARVRAEAERVATVAGWKAMDAEYRQALDASVALRADLAAVLRIVEATGGYLRPEDQAAIWRAKRWTK